MVPSRVLYFTYFSDDRNADGVGPVLRAVPYFNLVWLLYVAPRHVMHILYFTHGTAVYVQTTMGSASGSYVRYGIDPAALHTAARYSVFARARLARTSAGS